MRLLTEVDWRRVGRLAVPVAAAAATVLLLGLILTGGCRGNHARLVERFESTSRPEQRAVALARLGELNREDDFPFFLKGARDGSAAVRRAAADALGNSGEAKAIDTLGELLGDTVHEVQVAAAAGLARYPTDKSRSYLLNGFVKHDGPVRRAIAAALGATGFSEAVRHEAKLLWERNLKALESGGLAERVGAAEELGRSGRGDAVERLLPLLGDDSVLLAAGVARGLGAAKDARALAALTGVLKENYPLLREATAEALGSLGDGSAVGALEKMALEGGPAAIAAVRALGQLAVTGEEPRLALCRLAAQGSDVVAELAARRQPGCAAEPIAARLMKSDKAEVRAGLAALAALGTVAQAEKLVALATHEDSGVRLAATRALAALEVPGAGPVLLAQLQELTAQFEAARRQSISAPLPQAFAPGFGPELGGIEGESGTKLDTLLAKVEKAARERAEASGQAASRPASGEGRIDLIDDLVDEEEYPAALTLAVGRQKLEQAMPLLEKLAADPRAGIREAACEALGNHGSVPALAAAARCLEERSPAIAGAAARGLARAGPPAIPVLLGALERCPQARPEVIRALGELRAKQAVGPIAALLSEGGLSLLEGARALARIGDPAAAKPLAEQLGDPRVQARRQIIDALGDLRDPATAEALREELFSERFEIRAAAARALNRLGSLERPGLLEALRFDYYAEVRRAAEAALGKGNMQGAR